MTTNLQRPKPPWKYTLIKWAFIFFVLYTVVGFFILPPIIRIVAVKVLSGQLDRKVTIQKVKLNPLVPSIAIHGLLILDKDGQPFVSWDEVYVSFKPWSVFTSTWTFGKIMVVKPYARAQMNKDYTFNFSDLITKFTTNAPATAPPKEPSKPLLVCVQQLIITNATMSVADFTERTPFKRIIGPLHLSLDNFRTAPDNEAPYSFAGTTDAGELFAWHGYVGLTPLRSEGQLTVNDVTLSKFAPLYQDLVQFEIRSGQIGVHANYRFEWSQTNRVAAVTDAAFALRKFRLGQPGVTNDLIDVFHLAVTGASLDLEGHQAAMGRVFVAGAQAFLQRNKNNTINVVQISKPNQRAASDKGGIVLLLSSLTNAVTMLINSTNQWNAAIHNVDVTNCAIHLVDLANSRPATLDLDQITFTAKNISNQSNTNLTANASVRWNTNGQINVASIACLAPLTADVHLDLQKLNLNTLDPYLESQFNLLLASADFGMLGDVHVHTPDGKLPKIKFQGDVWLDNFRALDGVKAEDLLKWDSVRVSGITARLNPLSASINEIYAGGVNARVIIETNKAINLLEALHPANVGGAAQTNAVPVAKNSTTSATNALASLPPVTISSIVVSNAQINFTDLSLKPNVNVVIEQAGGTITDISSAQLQHGDVNLHALVDGVGPAKVTGHINPFSGTETNDIKITLASMDLLPTSPYSGKFAGYRIARGALYLDLEYHLVGRKLDSKNVITVDQFTFGDKVDSPDATKLPVRLAVDILKDRNGKIILDVPIQGSLDDPKLRIGKVVKRVIMNILSKVATSPFSLLGAAFGGGGEELSYQDFVPGGEDLSDAGKKKLDVLVKALYNRPGLELQISGSVDRASDVDGLQRIAFDKELRARRWMAFSKSRQAQTTPEQIVFTPQQRAHWVTKLYEEALADGKITPELLQAHTNLAAIAARIKSPPKNIKLAILLNKKSSPAQAPGAPSLSKLPPLANPQEALLTAIIPIPDSDLEALAIDRAKVVRTYILQSGKVEAKRLFLAQNPGGGLREDGSRVYLELE
jgi:Domain of Unknown Function (DUF748)